MNGFPIYRPVWGALCVLTALALSAQGGGTTLPFRSGFEDDDLGDLTLGGSWQGGGTTPQVQSSSVIEENRACYVTNDSALILDIEESGNAGSNVWIQFYAKVTPYDDGEEPPTIPVSYTGAFYVNTNRDLKVYVGMGTSNWWQTVATSVNTNQWIAFAVHVDYDADKWDIYMANGGTYGAPMTKLNTSAALNTMTNALASAFDQLVMTNGVTVDAVAASRTFLEVDNSTPSYVVVHDLEAASTNYLAIPRYHYGPGNNTLATLLGDELGTGFEANDSVWVRTNNWARFDFSSLNWAAGSGIPPGDVHLAVGDALWVGRRPGNDSAIFFPYTAVSNTLNPTVYGPDDPVLGWNLCAWPHSTARNVSAGLGINGKSDGDLLYVYNSDTVLIKRFNWRTGTGWREGRTAASYSITQGQIFWYYKTQNGSAVWNVTQF